MKVVDVVLEKVFDGFCNNICSLNNDTYLLSDLNLNNDIHKLIISRVEMVLSVNISKSTIVQNPTVGDFKQLIENAYNRKYNM